MGPVKTTLVMPARGAQVAGYELVLVTATSTHARVLAPGAELVIGRAEDVDLRIVDDTVSRRHAVVRLHDGVPTLEDLGSANGVALHGRRIPAYQRVPLAAGETVRIGATSLLVFPQFVQLPAGEPDDEPIAHAPAMRALHDQIEALAPGLIPILIVGETGVGKDVLARRIHDLSRRRGPFIRLDCTALTEPVLARALFGHEAAPGDPGHRPGALEAATDGTVFLDEIGGLTSALQPRLLQLIEASEIARFGGGQAVRLDVRFIAASHRDLAAEVAAGRFRADLYYRLAGFVAAIPPLRERREDMMPLAEALVRQIARSAGARDAPLLDASVAAALRDQAWPGNLRELRNALERAFLLSGGRTITAAHFTPAEPPVASGRSDTVVGWGGLSAAEIAERERILAALRACDGNQSRAAVALGVSRSTLMIKLDALRIPRPYKRPSAAT